MTETYIGSWSIARTIVDAENGTVSCSGNATLRRSNAHLRYDEAVSFRAGERLIRATRTYFYRLDDRTIVATFADGRPFFVTTLQPDGTATAIHHCNRDLYVGTLWLSQREAWQTRWTVSGTKALRITTRYTRAADQTSTIAPYVSGRRSR